MILFVFCLFFKFRETIFFFIIIIIRIVSVPLFGEASLIYLCVGYYLNCSL